MRTLTRAQQGLRRLPATLAAARYAHPALLWGALAALAAAAVAAALLTMAATAREQAAAVAPVPPVVLGSGAPLGPPRALTGSTIASRTAATCARAVRDLELLAATHPHYAGLRGDASRSAETLLSTVTTLCPPATAKPVMAGLLPWLTGSGPATATARR